MAKKCKCVGIESNRILYSEKCFHDLRLSEQQMGIIQHGLYILAAAFALEPEYLRLVKEAQIGVEKAFNSPVVEGGEQNGAYLHRQGT